MLTKTKLSLCTVLVIGSASATTATERSKHVRMGKPAASIYANSKSRVSQHSSNPSYDLYWNGQYIGSDPDQHIRTYLMHDRSERWDD